MKIALPVNRPNNIKILHTSLNSAKIEAAALNNYFERCNSPKRVSVIKTKLGYELKMEV